MPSTRLFPVVVGLAAVIAAGCSTMRREVVIPAHHPASPDALEAPMPPESTTLQVAPSTPAADASAQVSGHPVHHPGSGSGGAANGDAEPH